MFKKYIRTWKETPRLFRVITYIFLFLSLCIHIPFLEENLIIAWFHLIFGGFFLIGFLILLFEPSEKVESEKESEEVTETDIPAETKW